MEKKGTLEINSISLEALERDFVEMEIPKYRAAQVFRWIHKYAAASFSDLKNIPGTLQTALAAHFYISELTPMAERTSADGTVEYLFGLFDGQTVETVLILEEDRVTVCVSTQVGCAMGCSFCATGHAGFVRNLSSGEIAKQVEYINKSSQVTNIVFMGMGEPLLNYGAVIGAIRLLNCEAGIGLGLRRFTISTCGIVPRIYQLADEQGQVGLACRFMPLMIKAQANHAHCGKIPIGRADGRLPVSRSQDAEADHFRVCIDCRFQRWTG